MITGKRHCFHYEYEVGYGDDGRDPRGESRDGGARRLLRGPLGPGLHARRLSLRQYVLTCPTSTSWRSPGKTNTQSNTAFRGFGGPQGAIAIEYIIDNIARELGRDPLDVRKANFYGTTERNVTPYGMTVEDNVIHELVAELEASSRLSAAPRRDPRLQRVEPGAEERARADAGQVRHLVQRRALQPGGRARPRVHRRLGAGEPRRDRDGAGAQHQGRAGRRARARDQPRARALDGRRHEQGREHVGDRRVDRQRSQRQGGTGRRAADQGSGSRSSPRRRTAAAPRTSPSPRTR